jgi:hypothetical protein
MCSGMLGSVRVAGGRPSGWIVFTSLCSDIFPVCSLLLLLLQALVKQLQLNTRDAGAFIDQLNKAGGWQMRTCLLACAALESVISCKPLASCRTAVHMHSRVALQLQSARTSPNVGGDVGPA